MINFIICKRIFFRHLLRVLELDSYLQTDIKLFINPERSEDFYPGSLLRVAIGNFDGLHLGHRYIIQKTVSGSLSSKSMVITFRSYNHSIFTTEQKIEALFNLGVDYVMILPENIKQISKQDFLKFLQYFNIDLIVVGKNFKFGYQREGELKDLRRIFPVFESSYILDNKAQIISSTRIRSMIRSTNIDRARKLLGYTPYIQGSICKGIHKATLLGFSTINIDYPGTLYDHGVYVGRVVVDRSSFKSESVLQGITINIEERVRININEYKFFIQDTCKETESKQKTFFRFEDKLFDAVIHVGYRPTLRKINPDSYPVDTKVVEAHIIDSSFDSLSNDEFIYSRFYILNYLAREKEFPSEKELVEAMNFYVEKAKLFFS